MVGSGAGAYAGSDPPLPASEFISQVPFEQAHPLCPRPCVDHDCAPPCVPMKSEADRQVSAPYPTPVPPCCLPAPSPGSGCHIQRTPGTLGMLCCQGEPDRALRVWISILYELTWRVNASPGSGVPASAKSKAQGPVRPPLDPLTCSPPCDGLCSTHSSPAEADDVFASGGHGGLPSLRPQAARRQRPDAFL